MNIAINGEPRTFEDGLSLQQLISLLGLENKRLAIEVNQEIVPRSEHDSYILKQDDKVEIVHATRWWIIPPKTTSTPINPRTIDNHDN